MKTKPLVDMVTYIIVTIIFLIILIPALITGGGFYLITSWVGLANKIRRKEVKNDRPNQTTCGNLQGSRTNSL